MARQAGAKRAVERRSAARDEIEITPQMIEAGAELIYHWAKDVQESWVSPSEVAQLVWSAMRQSQQKAQRKDS